MALRGRFLGVRSLASERLRGLGTVFDALVQGICIFIGLWLVTLGCGRSRIPGFRSLPSACHSISGLLSSGSLVSPDPVSIARPENSISQ